MSGRSTESKVKQPMTVSRGCYLHLLLDLNRSCLSLQFLSLLQLQLPLLLLLLLQPLPSLLLPN